MGPGVGEERETTGYAVLCALAVLGAMVAWGLVLVWVAA
jgi:hypothetical protein